MDIRTSRICLGLGRKLILLKVISRECTLDSMETGFSTIWGFRKVVNRCNEMLTESSRITPLPIVSNRVKCISRS